LSPHGRQDVASNNNNHERRNNNKCYGRIPARVAATIGNVSEEGEHTDEQSTSDPTTEESRTELDSHANMPVVGSNAYILAETGQTADVNAFTPDFPTMQVPVVDAAVQYDCPYTGCTYILVIRNALSVPSLKHNLIPPFMMREAGVQVADTPKIQEEDPTKSSHSIYFRGADLRIPLALWGIFSYFPTTKPLEKTLEECEDVLILTPSRWNPHDPAYAHNEEPC
jgi:hypothetical protein